MEKITYYKIPATGGSLRLKEGTVKDLLLSIPYLLNAHIPLQRRVKGTGVIPPLKIINEILTTGIDSAGMSGGCKWEPFQINEDIFKQLLAELTADDPNYFRFINPPESVKTRSDWESWRTECIKSIAAQELKKKNSANSKRNSFITPAVNAGVFCGVILGIVTEAVLRLISNNPGFHAYPALTAFIIGFFAGFFLYYRYSRK
jgi:hypothetical protein